MSTHHPPERRRKSRLLALVTTALVATSGFVAIPAAAHAAPESITDGSISWGFKESWRNYATGAFAVSQGGQQDLTNGATAITGGYDFGPASSGTYDADTKQGSVTAPGSVRWHGFHGIDITLASPTVTFDLAAGTGSISTGGNVIATFTTGSAMVNETPGSVSVTGAPTVATQGTTDLFGAAYPAGTDLDPLGFSLTYALPAVATTTTLLASATSVALGNAVTLTATVAPAAAGSVEFFDGATSLGSSDTVGGVATLPVTFGATGTKSVTSVFTSTDTGFLGSTAAAIEVSVTAPAAAEATTTTVNEVTPAGSVVLGTETTIVASVAQTSDDSVKAEGSVEFFSIADGTTDRVSLGTENVDAAGNATLATTELTAGGHTFAAVFTPTNQSAFLGSEGVSTDNYGVIDTAAPAPYVPGDNAVETTGATASWDWSEYSSGWAKTATGNATVDEQTFILTDGVTLADAGGAVVSFEASLVTTAYGFAVVSIDNPALHLNADGSGVWVANVSGSEERIVVGTFSGVDAQPGADAIRTVAFDYEHAVASGTWRAGYSDSWPTAFVQQVPSSINSFYFKSGESAAQATKPPAPLMIDFDWAPVSETTLEVTSEGPAVLGTDVTLTATVGPETAEGEVEFFDVSATTGETSLGVEEVVDGVATLTTNALVAGGHTFRAVYTSSNGFNGSEVTTDANFGVVDVAQPAVCAPATSESETLTGVTAAWDWSAYSSGWEKIGGGNVTVDEGAFVLEGGVATVSADCAIIAFTGTLRVEAYANFFPEHGQWVELVNPVLTIDVDGNGAWSAGVRSGSGTLNTDTTAPIVIAAIEHATFPSFSDNSVNAQIDLAYEGTTAEGTWSAGRTDAWGNAFVLEVPSSVRSFTYATGANGDVNKAPAPITLDWAWDAELSGTVNGQATDAYVLQGQEIDFSAEPFRAGDIVSIVVNSDPVTLPSVTVGFDGVATQSWKVPADFATGAHSVTFSTGAGDAVRSVTVPFTVEAVGTAPDAGGTTTDPVDVCVARGVTGGSMTWEFKQSFKNYILGPIAHGDFSGGSFAVSGGSVNVESGGIGTVNFAGLLSMSGHDGTLSLQIVNPTVQITGLNSGVLYGTLTQNGSGGYIAISSLGFSSVSVTDSGLNVVGSYATLTGAAAAAFGGFYSAGTELDAVSFSATLGAEVPCDSTTDPVELAQTGAAGGTLMPLVALGAVTLLIGLALMRSRRRITA